MGMDSKIASSIEVNKYECMMFYLVRILFIFSFTMLIAKRMSKLKKIAYSLNEKEICNLN